MPFSGRKHQAGATTNAVFKAGESLPSSDPGANTCAVEFMAGDAKGLQVSASSMPPKGWCKGFILSLW